MEIERKFLINEFPYLECIKSGDIYQIYVSIDPEVRIREYKDHVSGKSNFKLTIKSDGDLCRQEIETYINEEVFNGIQSIVNRLPIHKIYKKYMLNDVLAVECSCVDPGRCSEFMYAEVEFSTEEEARYFVPPDYFGIEVTCDPYYKMKNYWDRTRLRRNV